MRTIRVSVSTKPQHATYQQLRAAWVTADEAGADALFAWDHFYPLSGDPEGTHFECWSLLAAMAEVTKRVEIGPMVTPVGYRNPNLLADMARTVDHISGGRVILGLGSGWFQRDYDTYGYAFKTAPERLRDLAAALPVIEDRLRRLNPRPVREKMPILIGGTGPKVTLRLAAQYADIWNGFGGPEEAGRSSRVLDEWCAKLDRDPATIERSVLRSPKLSEETADGYVANGITHIILEIDVPDWDPGDLERMIAWRDNRNRG